MTKNDDLLQSLCQVIKAIQICSVHAISDSEMSPDPRECTDYTILFI